MDKQMIATYCLYDFFPVPPWSLAWDLDQINGVF